MSNRAGRLWFDDNTKASMIDRLKPAAENYRKHMGAYPNTVYVNPKTNPNRSAIIGTWTAENPPQPLPIRIIETEGIAVNHFFLTVEDEP